MSKPKKKHTTQIQRVGRSSLSQWLRWLPAECFSGGPCGRASFSGGYDSFDSKPSIVDAHKDPCTQLIFWFSRENSPSSRAKGGEVRRYRLSWGLALGPLVDYT